MSFFAELKRRRVIPSGLAYLAVSVVVAEGGNIFGAALGLPTSVVDVLTILLIAGFPVFLVLSWVYDATPQGIRRTPPVRPSAPAPEDASASAPGATDSHRDPRAAHARPRSREKRRVTVLAAQARGYLSISERLDPEQAQELADRIADVAEAVCRRFEGHIHQFSGESLTVLFGVPSVHEDDALRGMRAALAFMDGVRRVVAGFVDPMLPELDEGCAVVSGTLLVSEEGGPGHGIEVTGDALLLASHLAGHANPGSVLAGQETFRQTEGVLRYEQLPPMILEGRRDPMEIYRLEAPKVTPTTVHGPGGLQGALVGRRAEMKELMQALDHLQRGRTQIVTVQGEAGTGKSRLVEEFKRRLDPAEIAWHEGHAFPYAQDTPYSLVVDLLSRRFGILDTDSPEEVRRKLEEGVAQLAGSDQGLVAWIGSLYELEYAELENVQPDAWRPRLEDAVFRILSAMALDKPTVILFEDLHWADRATVDLIRYVLGRIRQPALLLCTFRPAFELMGETEWAGTGLTALRIDLHDLSPSETQDLIEAILETDRLPDGLAEFVLAKVDGNPFYLEEVINTLVESGALVRRADQWTLTRRLDELAVPPTVQGLIQARLDRLDAAARRVLQEAAVIGRAFPVPLLREVASDPEEVDARIGELTDLGVIRPRVRSSDAEYVFNHVLTQEVVYGSLLRKDRQAIHDRIGAAIESLYQGRLPEFYEALALHYQRGTSSLKAVEYLARAGDKSWRRYSLDESDRYFEDAFGLLTRSQSLSDGEKELLVDVVNRWAIVFNHLGDFRTLSDLLERHEDLARAVARAQPVPAAIFFGWLGYALQCREQLEASYRYLGEALDMAGGAGDPEGIAYVSAWMARTCVDMGRLDEALEHGSRAEEMAEGLLPDAKLFRFIYSAIGLAYYFRGEREPLERVASRFLEYGERHTDLRSLLLGHVNRGCSHLIAGEFAQAQAAYEQGIAVSVDPMYSMYARLMLGVTHASAGNLADAEATLTEVIDFDAKHGFDLLGTTARGMMSIVLLSRGELAEGVRVAEQVVRSYEEGGNQYRLALHEYMLGRVYLRLVLREGEGGLAFMAKNVGFLVRNVPQARRKADEHLRTAIGIAREIGAKGVLGQALTDLGRLLDSAGARTEAGETLGEAVQVLESCQATEYLKEARRVLEGAGVSA